MIAFRANHFMHKGEIGDAPDAASKNLHSLLETIFILTGKKLI